VVIHILHFAEVTRAFCLFFQLAPPASLLEDFTYHWKMVMKFYVKRDAVSKTVIESTNIPSHMDQLLKVGWKVAGNDLSCVGR
jgi:hypothetical protein